jgi:hypothetical protein
MSRTYNSRGKVKHLVDEYVEYTENYHQSQKPTDDYPDEKWEEGFHRYDWSHTSDSGSENIYIKYRRHTNKKSHKGGGYSKEWKMTPSGGMSNCRQRFAGAYDRSDRMKGVRNSTKGTRRQLIKRTTTILIEEEQ